MKNIVPFILFILSGSIYSQYPVGLGYYNESNIKKNQTKKNLNDDKRYDEVRFKDISFYCEDYYLYPVFVEEFNYLSDVEQNFQFSIGWTATDLYSNEDSGLKPVTFYGNHFFAKQNGNVKCLNGKLILERKKEDITINSYSSEHYGLSPNDFPYTYKFTNAMLYSLFKVRKGVVEGNIKFPEFPYLWQAFWLYEGAHSQEIDIVEYVPNKLLNLNGGCSLLKVPPYSNYLFTIHNEKVIPFDETSHYSRVASFDPEMSPDAFFDVEHKYTLYWDNYKVDCYLDDVHRVRGRKYVSKNKDFQLSCRGSRVVPKYSWSCQGAQENSNSNKKIYIDNAFPIDDRSMNVIIGEVVPKEIFQDITKRDNLLKKFDSLQSIDKQIIIDRLIILQPVYLNGNFTIPDLSTYYFHSKNSSFLAANKIEFGPNCNIHIFTPFPSNNWNTISMHALAGDHVIITDEFIFEEGNHLRLESVDFSSDGFLYYSKLNPVFSDSEQEHDNPEIYTEDIENELEKQILYPNPAYDYLYFNAEEINVDLITDIVGRSVPFKIYENRIVIHSLSKGIYFVHLNFKHHKHKKEICKFIKE